MHSIDSGDGNDTGTASTGARSPEITITQLRYFVRSSELRSMSKAAASLYVAQSAISTSIANLERNLGTQLFVRHRAKGLSMTAEGVTYLSHVRGVLQALEDANLSVDPTRMVGSYEVGCFPTLVPFWMPSAIQVMRERYPKLQTKIREVRDDEITDRILNGEVELVLSYDFAPNAELDFLPIASAPPYAVVAADHQLAESGSTTLSELASTTPFILLDMAGSSRYFRGLLETAGSPIKVAYRLDNYEAVRAMVARGHGFTILHQQPQYPYTYDGFETRSLRLETTLQPLRIGLVCRTRQGLTRKGAMFAEVCREIAEERGMRVDA